MKRCVSRIQHEIAMAMSLRTNMIAFYSSFLPYKPLEISEIPNHDSRFLFELFSLGLLHQDQQKFYLAHAWEKRYNYNKSVPETKKNEDYLLCGHLASAIKNDDINTLQYLTLYKDFDFNKMLTLHDETYGYSKISIISLAAQKKALRCLKFLLLNGSNPFLLSESNLKWNTIDFAAASGMIEAMILLIDYGLVPTSQTLAAASKFHQNKILKWLCEKNELNSSFINESLYQAAEWNNIKGFIICIQNGANIFQTNEVFFFN